MKAIHLPVTGPATIVEVDWASMARAIDSSIVERVRIEGRSTNGQRHVLAVDEEGLLKGKPVNMRASVLYGYLYHGAPIVGDVLVMAEGWVEDGMDFVSMHDAESHLAYYGGEE